MTPKTLIICIGAIVDLSLGIFTMCLSYLYFSSPPPIHELWAPAFLIAGCAIVSGAFFIVRAFEHKFD